MAATQAPPLPTLISLDEYLHTSFHPDVDFVEGRIEHRRPPEGEYTAQQIKELFVGEWEHNKLQKQMLIWFANHEPQWPIDAVPEQRIHVSAEKIRICDVCVLRSDAPRESVTLTPPLLCIEIRSPEDRPSRIKTVLRDYHLMGVPNLWLIDPLKRTAHTFDGEQLHLVSTDRLEIPNSPIHIILSDLFRTLD